MALVFVFTSTKAHNPNTTSVVFSPINGIWMAQFTISQEGANNALAQFYSDKNFKNISEAAYKKMYVEYIKKKFTLLVDGNIVLFDSGGIKLGSHQTNIKFLLPDFPKEFKTVELNFPLFEENKEQNTVVKFELEKKTIRKILNHHNEFNLLFENNEKEFVEKDSSNTVLKYSLFGLFILSITGIILYFVKRKSYN